MLGQLDVFRCNHGFTARYIHACSKLGTRPRPLPFVTGHSPNLHAANHSLTDQDRVRLLGLDLLSR